MWFLEFCVHFSGKVWKSNCNGISKTHLCNFCRLKKYTLLMVLILFSDFYTWRKPSVLKYWHLITFSEEKKRSSGMFLKKLIFVFFKTNYITIDKPIFVSSNYYFFRISKSEPDACFVINCKIKLFSKNWQKSLNLYFFMRIAAIWN